MNEEQILKRNNNIIANYIRYQMNMVEKMSDQDVIDSYGGDICNDIIADFGDGTYIYQSLDYGGKFLTYIDSSFPINSKSVEIN